MTREEAIEAITETLDAIDHVPKWVFDKLTSAIDILPSADRPKGEWIFRRECVEDTPFTGYRCSNCNYWQGMGSWNFCPNCGADMRGEDE